MAEVLLFHDAYGLTPGVHAFADDLRAAGHKVHTPDLYEGRTFATQDEGVAHARETGFGEIIDRGVRSAEGLPPSWSTPASPSASCRRRRSPRTVPAPAGPCCSTRPCPPPSSARRGRTAYPCRSTAWTTTPRSSTRATSTPRASSSSEVADAELFLYPGDTHLFADRFLADYDEAAAGLLLQRVLAFLAARS